MSSKLKKHKPNYRTIPANYCVGNRPMVQAKEYLKNRIDQITPNIYAAFALTLSDEKYGWTAEQITDLFADTQRLWLDSMSDGRNMAQICSDLLDIDVIAGGDEGYLDEEGGEH